MFRIFVTLIILLALIGCDEGKQMMKPILTPEITEPAAVMPEETATQPLTFEADFERPEYPEGFVSVKGDIIHFVKSLKDYPTFDDSDSAIRDTDVRNKFATMEDWIKDNCGKPEPLYHETAGIVSVYFTSRQARRNFMHALPGKYWTHEGFDFPLDADYLEMFTNDEKTIFQVSGWIDITPDDKVYYGARVTLYFDICNELKTE